MNSNDPNQPLPDEDPGTLGTPYEDENPNVESVDDGLDVAEDEQRSAVADAYREGAARDGDDPDDIDTSDFGSDAPSPERPDLHSADEESPLPGEGG